MRATYGDVSSFTTLCVPYYCELQRHLLLMSRHSFLLWWCMPGNAPVDAHLRFNPFADNTSTLSTLCRRVRQSVRLLGRCELRGHT